MALVIKVEMVIHYDEATTPENFDYHLERSVARAIDDGMLSPGGEPIIDEYRMDVEVLEEGFPPDKAK